MNTLEHTYTATFPEGDLTEFQNSLISKTDDYKKILIRGQFKPKGLANLIGFLRSANLIKDFKKTNKANGISCCWPASWYLDFEINLDGSLYIQDIPIEVWTIPKIEGLKISYPPYGDSNQHLSALIGLQRDLVYLDLTSCRLRELPDSIQYCTKLKELRVACNSLKAMPGSIVDLADLTEISRSDNNFSFPYPRDAVSLLSDQEIDSSKNAVYSAKSLKELGTLKVAEISLHSSETLLSALSHLPGHFIPMFAEALEECMICRWCRLSFPRNQGYRIYNVRNSFRGYTYLPIEDHACSLSCKENIENFNTGLDVHQEGDVEVEVHDIEFDEEDEIQLRQSFKYKFLCCS